MVSLCFADMMSALVPSTSVFTALAWRLCFSHLAHHPRLFLKRPGQQSAVDEAAPR